MCQVVHIKLFCIIIIIIIIIFNTTFKKPIHLYSISNLRHLVQT